MERNNTQIARQVIIDQLLRAKRFPSMQQLSFELGVSRRTIRRDIDFMRDRLMAPIEYDYLRGGYCYSAEWNMPAVYGPSLIWCKSLTSEVGVVRMNLIGCDASVIQQLLNNVSHNVVDCADGSISISFSVSE